MTDFDGAAFGKEVVAEVKRFLKDQTEPLVKRIDGLETQISDLAKIDYKTLIGDAVASVLPKAINDALAGVDQRIAAVTLERSAFVDMIDKAVGTVHEELAEQNTQHSKALLEVSSSLQEVSAGFAESVSTLSETLAQINEDLNSAIVGVDGEVAKRIDALESQVSTLPVEAISGKDGRGIDKIVLSDEGHLLVKLSDSDLFHDLGEVIGKDGRDGKDGQNGKDGEKGLDFDIDWAVGKISDEVHRAVGELPVPVSITDIRMIEGKLSLTMSDGKNYDLGKVVGTDGKDVDRVELGKWISTELDAMVAAIPVPKGIEEARLAINGQLQVRMTGEDEFKSLGFVVGKDGTDGVNGKDASEVDVDQIISKAALYIDEKMASIQIPEPVSIKSVHISDLGELWLEIGDGGHTNLGKIKADEVDLAELNAQIKSAIEEVVAAIPPAPAGKDAVIDQTLLKQIVFEEVALQVSELPKPVDGKPGVGIKTIEVDEHGDLVVVLDTEEQVVAGKVKGADGQNVDLNEVQAIIAEHVLKGFEALPPPVNGKDGIGITDVKLHENGRLNLWYSDGKLVDLGVVKGQDGKDVDMGVVDETIRKEIALIPRPQDGKSITVEEVTPVLTELVSKAVAEIPVPKDGRDGIGLASALIDRAGELVVTLTNGEAKQLGPVIGRDGQDVDMGIVAATIKQHVDSIPRPKDGLDGVGFDDMSVEFDDDKKELVIYAGKGDNLKEWKFFVPMLSDKGVYKDGTSYLKSDGVTFGGSFWIAQKHTSEKPGTGDEWRLAVKKGRDGKDRPVEPKGPASSVKLEG